MGLPRQYTLPPGRAQAFAMLAGKKLSGEYETLSGIGSTLMATRSIREALSRLYTAGFFRSVLDAGCGDFNWQSRLQPIAFTGIDIVPELVDACRSRYGRQAQFLCADTVSDALPKADLILCRDVLSHLPSSDTAQAIQNFKSSGSTFLAATAYEPRTAPEKLRPIWEKHGNSETAAGYWRAVNLRLAPFRLPPPLFSIPENDAGKSLDFWRLADIQPPDIHTAPLSPTTLEDMLRFRFFRQLIALPYIEAISLYGSRARGNHRPDSDIDLIIHGEETLDYSQRMEICHILDHADTPLPIDCQFAYDDLSKDIFNLYVKPLYIRTR